jgi:hypothetical protein
MKKKLFLVLAGLTMISLSGFGAGQNEAKQQAYVEDQRTAAGVADLSAVPAVPDEPAIPRRNPLTKAAGGSVYALPAVALDPEEERLPPPPYAISGVKGQAINEDNPWWEVVDIVVILPENESFSKGMLEGYEVTDWIILPRGLKALAHNVKKGAKQIKIYISGTPEETWRDMVKVTIPGSYLTGGSDRTFVSPTEEESFTAWEVQQVGGN